MKQIIVPIDFSENSKNALKNAIIMARKLDMGLLLMHALQLPAGFTHAGMQAGNYKSLQLERDCTHKKLKRLMKDVAKGRKGINFQSIVTFGHLSHGLKYIEKYNEVAMVVMSSSGKNGYISAITGTNSYDVTKSLNCPVIVLPQNANIGKMKSIALAGDYFKVVDPHSLEQLIDIARHFFAHVEVIHVQEDDTLEDDQIDIGRGITRYLKDIPHTFHFRTYQSVSDGLVDFCQERNVDLLALIPHQKSVLDRLLKKSTTKALVQEVPMPLLVLQE